MADKVVRVELTAGSASFLKTFQGASKAAGDLQKGVASIGSSIESSFKGAASSLGPVGTALSAIGPAGVIAGAGIAAASAAVGGLVAFLVSATKGLVEMGGKLADLSEQTGLSTTTLQELRFAGALVGVSMEEAAAGVAKLQKGIVAGDSVFARLGLNLEQIRKLDTAGQFEAVAAAIKAIKDPTQQAAAAMEVFGKSGASLLPLIRSNTAAAREEFHKLGLEISGETVAAADALGDEATKLELAWEGVKNQLAAGIVESGALTEVTSGLVSVMGQLASFLQENKDVIRGFFEVGKIAGQELAEFLPTVRTGLQGIVNLLLAIPGVGKGVKDVLADLKAEGKAAAELARLAEENRAAARAGAAATGNKTSFVSQEDLDKASRLAAEVDKLAEAERRATIEANKRSAAEDSAVAKHNAEVQKKLSAATVSIFGTSKEASRDAEAQFGILKKVIEDAGKSINDLTRDELAAYEAQLIKIEQATRGDAEANQEVRDTLRPVQALIDEIDNSDAFVQKARETVVLVDQTALWVDVLGVAADALANLFANASSQADDFAARASRAFAQVAQGAANVKAAGGIGTTGGKIQAAGAAAGAAGSLFGENSKTGGTLSGVGTGIAAGAAFGPAGAIIGGVIGGVAGFLSARKKQKQALKEVTDAIIQQFGSLKQASALAQKYGIDLDKALSTKKPAEITKAIQKLNKELEKRAQLEQGLANAQSSVESLQDLTKGSANTALTAAVQALAQKVSDELGKAGLGFAATGPLRDSEDFKKTQSIAEATAGTLGGLRQAGVVDQGVLDAASTIAQESQKAAFDAAKAAGLDDAAANKASLGAISPLLREQLNASLATGKALDAKTQQLIDEAKANGIDILADPAIEAVAVAKKQLDVLNQIAGKGAGDSFESRGGKAKGQEGYARGTGGFRDFGTGTSVTLHGWEAVVPMGAPSMPSMDGPAFTRGSASLDGGKWSPSGGVAPVSVHGGEVSITVQGNMDQAALDQVIAAFQSRNEDLMFSVKQALGR